MRKIYLDMDEPALCTLRTIWPRWLPDPSYQEGTCSELVGPSTALSSFRSSTRASSGAARV